MKVLTKAFVAAVAAALAFVARADDATIVTVDGVEITQGGMTASGNAYTATSLEYYEPGDGDELNRSEAGWYVSLRRTYALSYTGTGLGRKYTGTQASSTKASFSDNAGNSVAEYGVYNVLLALTKPDNSPAGCGIRNRFQAGGLTPYMLTTDWSVCVTPELLKSFSEIGEPYVATLTVGGDTYTITVPFNTVLRDENGVQVYPEIPKHDHLWKFEVEGASVTARCQGKNTCTLCGDGGTIAVTLEAVGDKVKLCGTSIDAQLVGAEVFAATGAEFGEIEYYTAAGALLDAAPSEVGKYEARVTVTTKDHDAADAAVATLRLAGFEILAGEAVMNGVHVQDATEYLEKETGEEMEISVGRSYAAEKTYVVPAKYGLFDILNCAPKTYDLAGFTVTAPEGGPLFENGGTLVIRDTSDGGTGAIAPNPASAEDVVVVNHGTLVIEGGTFYGSIVNDGGNVAISGGLFAVRPDDSFVVEGYDLVRRGRLWGVEPHSHNYRFITLAGSHVVLAVCVDIFAEGSLQISHCPARVMVGIVGMRRDTPSPDILNGIKDWLGVESDGILDTLGKIPNFVIDYDRKEHEADFYALNLTAMAETLRNDSLLELVGKLAQDLLSPDEEASLVERLTAVLGDIFSSIGSTSSIKEMFVDKATFEKETGVEFGETSYLLNNEPFEGKPTEAGWYTAIMPFAGAGGRAHSVRGEFVINEKELPIETDHTHIWTFAADGAKVVATCNGGVGFESLWVNHCNVSPMAIELVPSVEGGRKEYDAEELSVAIDNKSTFEINTGATVSDVTYRTKDGETLDAPPVEPGEYVVEVTVTHMVLLVPVTDTASIDLVINVKQGTREFPNGSFRVLPSQTGRTWGAVDASGVTANVLNGINLDYDADAEAWTASMSIDLPSDLNALSPTPRYTDEEHIIVEADEDYSLVTGKFLSLTRFGFIDYVAGVVWSPAFTLDEAFAALDAGETTLEFEIAVGSNGWLGDLDGVKMTTFRLVVPLEGLVLRRGRERVDVAEAYDLYVNTHTISGLPMEHAIVSVDGEEIELVDDGTLRVYTGKTITVQPWDGFFATRFLVDGNPVEADDDGVYSFTMGDGDIEVDCEIVYDIGNDDYVTVMIADLAYTGETLEPVVEAICSFPEDFELIEDEDFTVVYFDAEENEVGEIADVGEYSAVLTGIGKFGGARTATFAVVDYAALLEAYKTQKKGEADGMALDGDSDECATLISDAKDAIDAVEYDTTKTLDELKAEVDAIITQLAADLATQRAADAEDAKQSAFADYKTQKKGEADGMALDGDSDACAQLISDAKDAIDALEYDTTKSLDELKAEVDAIITQLESDLATQRAADAEDAKQSAFADYKTQKKGEADGMALDGDSDACATLISDAKDAIDAVEYDTTKSLDELKAEVDAIITQLATDLATQRAADADAAKRAAFDDYKAAALVTVAGMSEEGDSDACTTLINDALDAIGALEYDETKSLDEQKNTIDDMVAALAAALVAQRATDAADRQQASDAAEFNSYKDAALVTVAAMAEEGDSDACTTLITDARDAIGALEYDSSKPLADQKAAIDGIVADLAAALVAQRAADADAAKRTAFDDYKTEKKGDADGMTLDGDSDACATLISDAKDAIDALEYDTTKSLDELKAEVDAILTQLESDLADQRAADADAAKRAAFDDYKAEKKGDADNLAEEGDSDECATLISDAKDAIDALEYDATKSLDELKAEVDAILTQLESDLADQRADDAQAAERAVFDDYKAEKKGDADDLAEEGDSDECATLISDAKDAIDALEYDATKSLDELKAEIDAILTQLESDLADQRADDAQAAERAAFDAYKAAALVTVAGMSEEGDSDACSTLINDALDAIGALEYDETKSLDEQKNAIDDMVAALAAALVAQRATDAADRQQASDAAEFDDYKAAALVTVAAMAEEGDSDACTTLITDALDAIDALEYDETKSLDEQKNAIDGIVADLAAALVAQRAADADAEKRAEFDDYKTQKTADAEALADKGDSEAGKALIDAAKDAIAAVEYDAAKSLDAQKAAVDAIVAKLATDLAKQRAADAAEGGGGDPQPTPPAPPSGDGGNEPTPPAPPSEDEKDEQATHEWDGLMLYSEVTGEVDLSKVSKWLAYLRSDDGGVAASVSIRVGKANRRTGVSKVKIVITYPGASRRLRMNGTVTSSGIFVLGENVLAFGSNAVKGVIAGHELDGSRDIFSSSRAEDKVVANAVLPSYRGYCTMVWGDEASGWATASVKISSKGKARIRGWLANGQVVSVSGRLALGDVANCVTFVSTKKTAPYAINVWFAQDASSGEMRSCATVTTAATTMAEVAPVSASIPMPFLRSATSPAFPADGITLAMWGKKYVWESPKTSLNVKNTTGRIIGWIKLANGKAAVKGYFVNGVGYAFARIGKVFFPVLIR